MWNRTKIAAAAISTAPISQSFVPISQSFVSSGQSFVARVALKPERFWVEYIEIDLGTRRGFNETNGDQSPPSFRRIPEKHGFRLRVTCHSRLANIFRL